MRNGFEPIGCLLVLSTLGVAVLFVIIVVKVIMWL